MTTKTRERPVLFSGPMIRAILDGTKTQTRRPIELSEFRPSPTAGYDWTWRGQAPIRSVAQQRRHPHGCWQDVSHAELLALCPHGQPGDRLWVRETFALIWPGDGPPEDVHASRVEYRADGDEDRFPGEWPAETRDDPDRPRWRPSIHMPRWASRIDLDIASVRVERVNEIGEADARAEGFPCADDFMHAWALIYGEAFRAWVWVVGFKRVERAAEAA